MSQDDSLESGEILVEDGELPPELQEVAGPPARSSSLDQRGPPPRRWERGGDDRLLPPPSHRSGPWPGPPLGRPAYPGPPPRRGYSPPRRGLSPPRRASPPPRRGFSPPRRGPSPPRRRELSPPRGLSPPRRGPPPRPGLSPPRGPPSPRRGPSPPPYPLPPRDRSSSRPASGRGGSPPLGGPPPLRPLSAEDEAARDAREMDDLAAGVKALTRTLTLQECLKDLGRVCAELRSGIRKATAYLELLQKHDESVAGAEDSAALAELGAVLLGGLRALHVYSNTGQGRSMGGAAREPVQAAWQARERLLTAAQRKQLEGFVSSSKNFAALLEDKEPSPQPVRRDYVPAPRPQPQPKEKKQKRAAVAEEEPVQPQLSKRQQKRLQAQQRAEAEAAARAQRAAEAAAQQAAPPPPPGQQQRGAEDAEAGQPNKRYKLTIRLGSGSLAALGESAPADAPPPAPPLPPAPAAEDRQLAAALDEHWRWHEEQQTAQQQGGWSEQPAPPPDDAPGGWQQLAPVAGDLPSRPASAASAQPPMALGGAAAANGSAAAPAQVELNPAAVDHAAGGLPAIRELLGQGKLCLVLDLDHTLLNSATFTEVGPVLDELLSSRAAAEANNLPQDKRLLFRMDGIRMYTKLRPGVREFLTQASRYFQLWIHTNGNRAYADSVCRLLDPDGAFFGDRIIAQGADRLDQMVPDQAKRLMQGLAEREAITVIVDDSHSVWAQHSHNLVAVERYIYFPSSRAALGLRGPSLLDIQRDEDDEQGMLMVTLQVLMRVHGAVMAALRAPPTALPSGELVYQNWDVRHALARERQQVLAGVRLVFTRVIPLEQEPSSHPLWRLAESFGATCSNHLDAATTHVIAGASGTEKVLTARQMGKSVVTPAWLECSCILWKRANEDRFLVPL